jgi:hypothetical protein
MDGGNGLSALQLPDSVSWQGTGAEHHAGRHCPTSPAPKPNGGVMDGWLGIESWNHVGFISQLTPTVLVQGGGTGLLMNHGYTRDNVDSIVHTQLPMAVSCPYVRITGLTQHLQLQLCELANLQAAVRTWCSAAIIPAAVATRVGELPRRCIKRKPIAGEIGCM